MPSTDHSSARMRSIPVSGTTLFVGLLLWSGTVSSLELGQEDTYTRDMNEKSQEENIRQLIAANIGLPSECRKDTCKPFETKNRRKGTIKWKETVVGHRRFTICPFDRISMKNSAKNVSYAVSDCELIDGKPEWGYINMDNCSDPPSTILMQITRNKIDESGGNVTEAFLQESMEQLARWYKEHPTLPVLVEDTGNLVAILNSYLRLRKKVPQKQAGLILYLCNKHLDDRDNYSLGNGKLLRTIIGTVSMIDFIHLPTQIKEKKVFVAAHALQPPTTPRSARQLHFSDAKSDGANESTTMNVRLDYTNMTTNVEALFLVVYSTGDVPWPALPGTRRQPASYTLYTTVNHQFNRTYGFFHKNKTSDSNIIRGSRTADGGRIMYAGDENTSQTTHHVPSQPDLVLKSNILYVSLTADKHAHVPRVVDVSFTIILPQEDRFAKCVKLLSDSRHAFSGDKTIWQECESTRVDGLRVTCHCNGHGFYSLFGSRGLRRIGPSGGGNIATFFGFPYIWELHVFGHVLRAVALLCLFMTLLTFFVFRKLRRGRPTHILMNLCLALVGLLLIFYLSDTMTGSKYGCRWANGLRLYFVLAALCWNGVEAVNMYLMLVKVFKTKINKFVLKAALVAWSLPIIVGVATGLSESSAFDGVYVDCIFTCRLKKQTMLLSFLVPMAVILTHNMIIFVMVLRVIINHGKNHGAGKNKGRVTELAGAFIVLVLLGFPWIFSAFATIDSPADAALSMVEGIAEGIFIFVVNSQGVFIFLFNCARVTEVRIAWTSTLTSRWSRSTRSKSNSKSSSRKGSSQTAMNLKDKQNEFISGENDK